MLMSSGKKTSLLILFACIILTGTASAGGITAYVGDVVPLSGYSSASNNVYLYLTGPNLPVNGVALNDVTKLAEDGNFKVVPVMGDGSWSYKWGTSDINGHLDAGTYTIWVADCPCDRAHLQHADYGTISVTLGTPGISAGIRSSATSTPTLPGSLIVSSTPDASSVTVNGQYKGSTPLTLDSLSPGDYTVNVTRFGYAPYSATVDLKSGETLGITATLPAERGSLAVNTSPSGANITVDGRFAGISPVVIPSLIPGNHTVEMIHEGYVPETQQAAITAGSVTEITAALRSSSSVTLPQIPGKTPLPVGIVLAAFVSAIAIFGYYRSREW